MRWIQSLNNLNLSIIAVNRFWLIYTRITSELFDVFIQQRDMMWCDILRCQYVICGHTKKHVGDGITRVDRERAGYVCILKQISISKDLFDINYWNHQKDLLLFYVKPEAYVSHDWINLRMKRQCTTQKSKYPFCDSIYVAHNDLFSLCPFLLFISMLIEE